MHASRPPITSERPLLRRLLPLAGLCAVAGLGGACVKKLPARDAYGLTLVDIEIDSENLAKLNSTVWAKVPFGGALTIGDRRLKADISYSGKSTIDAFKKSFELHFADGERFRSRSTYRVASQPADGTGVKALIGYPVFAALGLPTPATEPVTLYLNGKLQGLYTLIEPVDSEFLSTRGITARNLVKALYGNAEFDADNLTNVEAAFDSKADPELYVDVKRLIEIVLAPNSEENLRELGRMLDLDVAMRYIAAAVVLYHWDGFRNNIFLYREVGSPTFRIVPWDLDRIYDETKSGESSAGKQHGTSTYVEGKSLYGEGGLCAKIFSYPELKARYHEIMRELVEKTMPYEKLAAAIDEASLRTAAAFTADRVLSSADRTAAGEAAKLKESAERRYKSIKEELAK